MDEAVKEKQLRFKVFSQSKRTLTRVLILAVLVLTILPFWTALQDGLTKLVMSIGLYKSLQNVIVPYELRVIGSLLTFVGFPIRVGNAYIEWTKASGGNEVIYLAWNCIGWQSLLFFIMTAFVGLQGDKYSNLSKFKALMIGFLGTFLVNLFRIAIVALIAYYLGQNVAIIFHDYGSTLVTLGWLFVFWWFSYSFVLETKNANGMRM